MNKVQQHLGVKNQKEQQSTKTKCKVENLQTCVYQYHKRPSMVSWRYHLTWFIELK